jgi:hypothetical protein
MTASIYTLDHVIIAVNDLDSAMNDYGLLGFTTFFGGRHARGTTHNALIVFADGSYLELLAPTGDSSADNKAVDYLPFTAAGEGLSGYALGSTDLAADVAAMRAGGVAISDPTPGSRARPDGKILHWRTAVLKAAHAPFWIEDITPRGLRVPDDPTRVRHPNGVTGIAGLVVAVADFDRAQTRYQAMLSVEPQTGSPVAGAQTVDFRHPEFVITLAAPEDSHSPLAEYLSARGESPYMLKLRTTHAEYTGFLDVGKTHAARVELVQ